MRFANDKVSPICKAPYGVNWKDRLTAYNGTTISYNAIGSVTNDGTWTYTWQGGKQPAGMAKSGTTITYDYDHNGQRVKKTVNGTETKYAVEGKRVTHLTKGAQQAALLLRWSGPTCDGKLQRDASPLPVQPAGRRNRDC